MRQIPLGTQGLVVSAQGLGCMGMSAAYGSGDEQESLRTLAQALDHGVTFFDTAEVYGPFTNEELLGTAFAGKRDAVVLATKVGFQYTSNGDLAMVDGKPIVTGKPSEIRVAVEGSLRRLRTDFVDLVYLHRIDPLTPIEETIGELATLVRDGKVRTIGVSEASAITIRKAHAIHPLTAVQSEFSLFEREVERDEVLKTIRELRIGFVAYSPLGRGLLSGALTDLNQLAPDDFRRFDPRFQGGNLQANLRLVERIKEIAVARNVTPSQLAIAWTMNVGAVPIPGTKRSKYLAENIAAADLILRPDELAALNEAAPIGAATGDRYSPAMMETLGH
ncbi:aldo/keto reductase [Rhizobium sp. SG741]|uniref:aldo/keto reductase n=1 Tax=Rhizobium sp. SG741 TaxID=2587114 RepID=UPI00144517F8|nr:aldo/keto reductase [Rhizobium sp. SG741]NKJ08400.1 aryl-alcohol dehydrogenase-like predicted oxidoreductase [Rhizobium sp. SG741]